MKPDPENVNRLGFEAWADNVIVNIIENFEPGDEYDSYVVRIERYPSETNYVVSAYVDGKGWLTHNRSVKR
ncbi:hypothetical protein UFOVP549_2 [uncultured Caudovirales phage]|jgi:hypothetical protein|uniref:Uncharacterized protein n=1 Tax=uncultured Caudovirales phage TaxID=2100421 RepID=A0A6J5N1I1_9CAUD|nr:hypothetical protein UFOVP549_2 [uncultured Caudovirales phage]